MNDDWNDDLNHTPDTGTVLQAVVGCAFPAAVVLITLGALLAAGLGLLG